MTEPTILTDEYRIKTDLKMLGACVRKRWDVSDEVKAVVVDRLRGIVAKETVTVMTKEGPVNLEGPADSNAVAASRVLAAIEAQNQADEHHAAGSKVKHEHTADIDAIRSEVASILVELCQPGPVVTIEGTVEAAAVGSGSSGGQHCEVLSVPDEPSAEDLRRPD